MAATLLLLLPLAALLAAGAEAFAPAPGLSRGAPAPVKVPPACPPTTPHCPAGMTAEHMTRFAKMRCAAAAAAGTAEGRPGSAWAERGKGGR